MSEVKYALPDEVHALLAKARMRCQLAVKLGIMSKDRAMAAYREVLRNANAKYLRPVDDTTRMIMVECRFCQHRELVRSDVVEFKCNCRPQQTQITFLSRVNQEDPNLKLEGPLGDDFGFAIPQLPKMGRS